MYMWAQTYMPRIRCCLLRYLIATVAAAAHDDVDIDTDEGRVGGVAKCMAPSRNNNMSMSMRISIYGAHKMKCQMHCMH